MNLLKKTALSIGAAATVIAPLATVVSCGTTEEKTRNFNLLPTYTGQADQLIALGVHSDYYPMQLNVKHPYAYLTNPSQYMVQQSDDFKSNFGSWIGGLMPKTQGVSWWNQDAKNSDDHRVDNTYWQKQKGSILLYEHYLLDDDQKVIEASWAPKHERLATVQTNFRASRDPYTRIPKAVFFGWDLAPSTIKKIADGTDITQDDIKEVAADGYSESAEKIPANIAGHTASAEPAINIKTVSVTLKAGAAAAETVIVTKKEAKIIQELRKIRKEFVVGKKKESEWFYNDWFFVDFYHRNYLDNKQFQDSHFTKWLVDSTKTNPFDQDAGKSGQIKALFDASTYNANEAGHGLPTVSTAHGSTEVTATTAITAPTTGANLHHPIYEQQDGNIGAAPMFEGAMRDNQLYLFNVASQVSNLATYGTPYGKQHYDALPHTIARDGKHSFDTPMSREEADKVKAYVKRSVSQSQLTEMKAAFTNANQITGELKDRMTKMKAYFNTLGVNGKTFGLLTIAPGHGVSTIQTMSKYSFIYNELGFRQPLPKNIGALAGGAKAFSKAWTTSGTNPNLDAKGEFNSKVTTTADAVGPNALFNMDDNGWFWNLSGAEKDEKTSIDMTKLEKFEGTFDMGVIASRDLNFNSEVSKNALVKQHLAKLFKGTASDTIDSTLTKARLHGNYDLWNEGLKTPFVMHMLLDIIMKRAEDYATKNAGTDGVKAPNSSSPEATAAKSWGTYFNSKS